MSDTLFAPETREVPLKGRKPLVMRGLTLFDLPPLVKAHEADFNTLRDHYTSQGSSLSEALANQSALTKFLILDCPGILVDVLVLCDTSKQLSKETAPLLPMGAQMAAVTAIVVLTCEDVGGPKEFLTLMAGAVERLVPKPAESVRKGTPAEIFYPTRDD